MSHKKRITYDKFDKKLKKMAKDGIIGYNKLQSGLHAIGRSLTKDRLLAFLEKTKFKLSFACKRLLHAVCKSFATIPDHHFV